MTVAALASNDNHHLRKLLTQVENCISSARAKLQRTRRLIALRERQTLRKKLNEAQRLIERASIELVQVVSRGENLSTKGGTNAKHNRLRAREAEIQQWLANCQEYCRTISHRLEAILDALNIHMPRPDPKPSELPGNDELSAAPPPPDTTEPEPRPNGGPPDPEDLSPAQS